MEERILRVISQARRQLSVQILRDKSLFWMGAASVLAALVLFAALFIPLYSAKWIAAGLLGAGLLLGLFLGILRRPTFQEAAESADRTGLQEHLSTALERRGQNDLFSNLQREETVRLLEGYPLKERLKKPFSRRHLAVLGGSIGLSLLFLLIPTRAKLLAEKQHDLLQAKKEEIEKIEEKLEELEELLQLEVPELGDPDQEKAELLEKGREEWEQMLSEGMQELKQATGEQDLEEIVKRLEKKEEQLMQQLAKGDPLEGAGQSEIASLENPGTGDNEGKDGTDGIETGDGAENGSGTSGNPGIEAGEGTGTTENPGTNTDNKNNGTGGNSGIEVAGISGVSGVSGNTGNNGNTGNGGSVGEGAGASGNKGSGNSGNGSNGNGGGSGSGGNGEGSGNGNGEGSDGSGGNGNGSGNGNGAGTGSNGSGDGSGGGWNQGSAVGVEREHESTLEQETVILPGTVAEGERLTGAAGEEGTSYLSPDQIKGEGYAGQKTEYEAVLGSYSEKAYGQIERNEIPSDMQDVVKKYFSGLGGK